jgi:hypothetical protein
MESPIPVLDTREFALAAWTVVGISACLLSRHLRRSLAELLKTLLGWKLLIIFLSMIAYVAGLVALLSALRMWTPVLISETILWFLFSGLLVLFGAVRHGAEKHFFRRTLRSLVTVAIVLGFVLNLRTLPLVLELLLMLTLFVLVTMLSVAELKQMDRFVQGFLLGLLVAIFTSLLTFTLVGVWTETEEFLTYENALEFLIPAILTVGFLPFVYGVALLSTYGTLFRLLNLNMGEHPSTGYAKRRAIQTARLNLGRVHALASGLPWRLTPKSSEAQVDRALLQATTISEESE